MPVVKKLLKILRDYCENSSLAGLGYIFNQKIHMTERLFWLICIIISAAGSYYLIREYQYTFESKAISLVIEGTRPQDKSDFPAIGVCEDGNVFTTYDRLHDFIEKLQKNKDDEYNFDVEDFLLRIVFPNMYSSGSLRHYCEPYFDCEDCNGCPTSGYKELAALARANCTTFMLECSWNGKPFNCCDYFLPLQTATGGCFLMNSLQTTERNGPQWLETEIGWDAGDGLLELVVANPMNLHLLNAEDIPSFLLADHSYAIAKDGTHLEIQLNVESVINDLDVREVSPEFRSCRFPDENLENSSYIFYSFTTCISDCLKQLQLQSCGCISHNYLVTSTDKSPLCDYKGFLCLDQKDILQPRPSIMQPWRSNGLTCKCLPSCTAHQINVFQSSTNVDSRETNKFVSIRQSASNQLFRRQAVRTRLDVVVTIGGILGLFMGASILSAIEFFYFFLVRICHLNN